MTVAPSDEKSLPAAIDNLYTATSALIDPRKELVDGALMAAPSLYESLIGAIGGEVGEHVRRSVAKSRPPCWIDALDLRVNIDNQVRQWRPQGSSTPVRLKALTGQKWRPDDCATIRDYVTQLRGWADTIKSYLDPEHVKGISAACPACGTRWVYRHHSGEEVRQPALQLVAQHGCTCLACDSFWEPSRYLFLCRLLGFELPAGVLT